MLAKAQLRSNSKKAKADRLLNQGTKQAQTGQVTAALQSWEEALKIYREIKDLNSQGKVLGNLGIGYNVLGDYAKAIDYCQQSLKIAREIENLSFEGAELGNLGLA